MELSEVRPGLHRLEFTVGQAYLWSGGPDEDGLTLIDAGPAGAAPEIAAAIESLGHRRTDVRRVVVTHGHEDHIGGLADVAAWGRVSVLAHAADAPIVRGRAVRADPVLEDFERPIWANVQAQLADLGLGPDRVPPARVDREIGDGDVVEFGGGARVLSVPGHTDGSIAVYLPEHRVLFTGDAVAAGPDGTVILGVFNTDRPRGRVPAPAGRTRRRGGLLRTRRPVGTRHEHPPGHRGRARLTPTPAARDSPW